MQFGTYYCPGLKLQGISQEIGLAGSAPGVFLFRPKFVPCWHPATVVPNSLHQP